MKKTISIRCTSLRIFSRAMVFVFVIPLFVSQSILQAEMEAGSFDFDGRLRNYMVYLPKNYTDTIDFPLVICLHPYGWTAERMMNYTNFNQVADDYNFTVVYPSAIPNWNSGVADNPNYPTPNVDDVGFINALIDIMNNRHSIDPARIYACGFSNGGFMSYKLACQLGHRIAAIASVGGMISTSTAASCSPLRTMPVLHIHGTADPYARINGLTGVCSVDQTLSYWINFNDCLQIDTTTVPDLDPTDGCTVEKTTYTDCSDNSNVVYYKVINGGHTWPGASPVAMGSTNQDIDASVEIWNFFRNYRLVTDHPQAWNPDPPDGAAHLETWAILSWGIGAGAVSHNVYFGENCEDVNNGTGGTFHGEQTETSFTVGSAGCPYPDGLAFETTYYWRIDEVNDLDPNSPYKGYVWSFKVSEPGLLAHWRLDENEGDVAYDGTGVYDAVLNGAPTWQPTSGMVGGALELDGTHDYLSTPFILNPADEEFSVFAWIKGGAPGQVIVSQEGGADWLLADVVTGTLMTSLVERAGRFTPPPLVSQVVITDGSWHRAGFVWDGRNRTLYVDDVIVAEDTQSGLADSLEGLLIGCGKDMAAGTFWQGLIDDVRIYNRAVKPQ